MPVDKSTRRRFVQLTGGLALALRHGLLPAKSAHVAGRTAATLEDASIRVDWDSNLNARVSRVRGPRSAPMTGWGASDYLLRADGQHVARFTLKSQSRQAIEGVHGPGTRLILSGTSADGIEKSIAATLYSRHPGLVLYRVTYRN